MKLIFRPIFIVFFVILTATLAVSMSKKLTSHQDNNLALEQIKNKNQQLLNERQSLLYQTEMLNNDEFLREKLLRDQKWLKKNEEINLSLSGYQYTPRPIIFPKQLEITSKQKWQQLWQTAFNQTYLP